VAQVREDRAVGEHLPPGAGTILLVEDDDMVRRLARRALEQHGYTVLAARVPSEAVRLFREWREPISLLLTDVVMPEMSGQALAEQLLRSHPDIKVLYTSGYTDNALVKHGVLEAGLAFLGKPFTPAELVRQVGQVLGGTRR
jgi:CheY-like chemotaxis protein